MTYGDPCGRPTKKSRPCGSQPLAYWRLPKRDGRPHSCLAHLTPTERAEYEQELQQVREAEDAARARFFASEPACWAWPLPEATQGGTPENILASEDSAGLPPEIAAALQRLLFAPENRDETLLHQWQAGRCAVCGRRATLVTDHDHVSGLVRGLLCQSCNTLEAAPDHSTQGPFARYRERPPTEILGVEIRYLDTLSGEYAPDRRRQEPIDAWADRWTDAASEDIGL